MGSLSIWHWLIVLAAVLLVFGGAGRISGVFREVGSGIKALRDGLKED